MLSKVYTYQFFGLGLHSEIPFPELKQEDVPRDVLLRLGPVDGSRPDGIHGPGWSRYDEHRIEHGWDDVGKFLLKGTDEFVLDLNPTVDLAFVRSMMIGQFAALMFARRGYLPLHASSVVLNERVFALTAESGTGKSTAALSLVARGAKLYSDDLLPVDFSRGGAEVHPGTTILKLSPSSRAAVSMNLEAMPMSYAREEKDAYRAPSVADRSGRELAGLMFLESGDEFRFEPMSGPSALFQLQGAIHRRDLLPQTVGTQAWMERTALGLRRFPVAKLVWVRDLARIDEMAARTLEALGDWS